MRRQRSRAQCRWSWLGEAAAVAAAAAAVAAAAVAVVAALSPPLLKAAVRELEWKAELKAELAVRRQHSAAGSPGA